MPEGRTGRMLLIEGALITFAVVIGFLVSDWGDNRQRLERAEEAQERIAAELAVNREEIGRTLPYWTEMMQRLDSVLAREGDASIWEREVPPGWRGLSPPSIRRASWIVAQSTGALERVPFGAVDEAAMAYEALDDLDRVVNEAIGALLDGQLERVAEWRRAFALLVDVGRGAEIMTTRALNLPSGSASVGY